MYRKSKSAFTLVELLVVIGIIAVMIAILLPALAKAREAALQVQCMSNQRQIMTAMVAYTIDNDGWMPPCEMGDLATGSTKVYTWEWYSTKFVGKYLANSANQNGRSNTRIVYCPALPAFNGLTNPQLGWLGDLGIGYCGIKTEYGATPEPQIAWRFMNTPIGGDISTVDNSATPPTYLPWTPDRSRIPLKIQRFTDAHATIILLDVFPSAAAGGSGAYKFMKFYNDQSIASGFTAGPYMGPSYRHMRNCNVAFADGHVESFGSNYDDSSAYKNQKDQGVNKALTDKTIKWYAGPWVSNASN